MWVACVEQLFYEERGPNKLLLEKWLVTEQSPVTCKRCAEVQVSGRYCHNGCLIEAPKMALKRREFLTVITMDDVMNATAITYPYVTVTDMTGQAIKSILEDVCDNLFNLDPYYQQGGDRMRVGGMRYDCHPTRTIEPHQQHACRRARYRRKQALQSLQLGTPVVAEDVTV